MKTLMDHANEIAEKHWERVTVATLTVSHPRFFKEFKWSFCDYCKRSVCERDIHRHDAGCPSEGIYG